MINLALAFLWAALGIGALLWTYMHPQRDPQMGGINLYFVAGGAFALAVYNSFRWWLTRPRREMDWSGREFPPRKPPRVVDYNPELDFSKPEEGEGSKGEGNQQKPG